MKGIILDQIQEDSSKCFLTKVILKDYITSLPADYRNYDIQREIVSNIYLDDLISTILARKHIPPIVLVSSNNGYNIKKEELKLTEFKILDGLQRTFRLKTIFDTIEFVKAKIESEPEILELNRIQLARKYRDSLEKINSSSVLLNILIQYCNRSSSNKHSLKTLFDRTQWFEIWVGLTPDEEVIKMLTLNAGHKPVKTKHQLELLFRNIIPILKKIDFQEFEIIREREISSTLYSKTRKVGQFHFSHLITSILSFGEGRPLTSNVDLIQKTQTDYFNDEIFDKLLQLDFLKTFVSTLLELDKKLTSHYSRIGTKWMGRETSLVGLFAAAGKFSQTESKSPAESLRLLKNKIVGNPAILDLEEFEKQRNNLDLAKINIGTINKNAVYDGIFNILIGKDKTIHWSKYFKGE